jgi:hypothetical protein
MKCVVCALYEYHSECKGLEHVAGLQVMLVLAQAGSQRLISLNSFQCQQANLFLCFHKSKKPSTSECISS